MTKNRPQKDCPRCGCEKKMLIALGVFFGLVVLAAGLLVRQII